MQDLWNPAELQAYVEAIRAWALANLLTGDTAMQVTVLVAAATAAVLAARRLTPRLERQLEERPLPHGVRTVLRVALRSMRPILFLVLVWLAIGVLLQLTWPSRTYLLQLIASLTTAWIVIRASSSVIRNSLVAGTVAVVAWSIAALNIVGLLGPTVAVLDEVALTLGDLRLSLLTIAKGLVALGVLVWGATALGRLAERRIDHMTELTPTARVLMAKLLRILLIALAVIIGLNSVGIDLTALAVLSGAIAFGIGFGLQKVVSNLISGMILLLDKSIKPGDVIELGQTFGWISKLGARYVSVVTRDGKEYLIPNEDLITHQVVNWSFTDRLVRQEIRFGVSYASDPHAVRRIAREAAATPERVMPEPRPVCHLEAFGDSSLDFILRFWIRDPQNGVKNVTGEVLLAIWDAFTEAGIEIPFPQRDLHLKDAAGIRVTIAESGSESGT